MTLGDLRTAIQNKIGGAVTTGQIDDWAYEAVIEILTRTKINTSASSYAVPSSTENLEFATLSSTSLLITEIWLESDGQDFSLERVTPADIIDKRRAQNASGPTRYYATDGDLLMFYPALSTGDTVHFLRVALPTQATDTAHDFSSDTYGRIPVQFHKAIEYYVLREAGDWDDDGSSQMGASYDKLFERYIVRMNKQLRDLGGRRRLGRAQVNRKRRQYIPHDNSMDVR